MSPSSSAGDGQNPTRPSALVRLDRADGTSLEIEVTETMVVGRDAGDIVTNDPAVSRLHAELTIGDHGLTVADLGSSNSTYVNGSIIEGAATLAEGDRVGMGDSRLSVLRTPPVGRATRPPQGTGHSADSLGVGPPDSPRTSATQGGTASSSGSLNGAAPSRDQSSTAPHANGSTPAVPAGPPRLDESAASLANDAVEVRFRPGSPGERAAPVYLDAAAKARRNLAGIGAESWGAIPVVHLVDPFPDPAVPGALVTSGGLVDGAGSQAWVVTTAEQPPEDPHRTLCLLFGHALPNAARVGPLLEGYGLHLSGSDIADPAPELAFQTGDLDELEGDERASMTVAFVRFLLKKEGDAGLRRVFGASTGQLDQTVRSVYGSSMPQLEESWRRELAQGEPDVKPAEFLKLSWKYLRPYKLRQVEVFGYMLLSLAFTAAFPFVTRRLFDTAIPSGEFSQVMTLLGGLGIAFVVSLVAGVRQAYQSGWITGAVTRDLRAAAFDRLQHLPANWYHQHPQGDVLARLFSDVGQVQGGLTALISTGVMGLVSLAVSAVIMLRLNLYLGLIVLIVAPLVAVVYKTMSTGARERSMAMQEANSGLLSVAAENYQANPVVRVFGLAGRERRRFAEQAERMFRSERRLELYSEYFGLSVNMIVTMLRLVVLGLGAWLILEGRFTLGGLVAFLSVVGEVLNPVASLTGLGQHLQESMGSLIRVDEVLNAETEPDGEGLTPVRPVTRELRLDDVHFAYNPAKPALSGVDVTIEAGTRVAFVGPSGSGKSTILRLLMRLYEPDSGAILIDGADLADHTIESWRSQLGVVFQDSFLFDATLAENIALGRPGATEAEIRAAAEAADVTTFVDRLDGGFDSLVGEGGSHLSGGQRQRVAIARALIRNPSVLLLDEATSALDPGTERQITETLRTASQGRTVISITHRLASVSDFDQIVVIDDGQVLETGNHAELMASDGLYAAMWNEQNRLDEQGRDVGPQVDPGLVVEALSKVAIFEDLSPAELAPLSEQLNAFSFPAEQTLSDPAGLVVVLEGRGRVLTTTGRATGAMLDPGDAFGVVSLLGGAPMALLAEQDLLLGHLDAAAIDALARQHPSVGDRLQSGHRVVAPATSTRLTRMTMGPAAATSDEQARAQQMEMA